MAPQPAKPSTPAVDERPTDEQIPIGPPSGLSAIPTPYITEQNIRRKLKNVGYDEAREDSYRLKGVQLIDNVREHLQLPVRTFATAANYFHKFRTRFPHHEYDFADVALASLFVACKVEDTIKKSREILCTAHNLKHPNDHKTPDDKAFEHPSGVTIGLERHILETIGFDFMGQYPQKLLVKMVGKLFCPGRDATDQKTKLFLRTSYDMSIDLYKTFAPIKQTNAALVLAVLELTALLLGDGVEEVRAINPRSLYTERGCVYETMLDLLDLYHQFSKSTKIGPRFDINKLMGVKIDINNRMSEEDFARYEGWCDECDTTEVHPVTPGSAKSPATNHSASGSSSVRRKGTFSEGTQRFVFDAEEARKEKSLVSRYFDEEFEEYEVEVEEPIREPEPRHPSNARNNFPHRGNSHGHNDRNWGPYSRGGRQNNYSDRSRGRKGPGY